eukprot:scpid43980/ scgid34793/ 
MLVSVARACSGESGDADTSAAVVVVSSALALLPGDSSPVPLAWCVGEHAAPALVLVYLRTVPVELLTPAMCRRDATAVHEPVSRCVYVTRDEGMADNDAIPLHWPSPDDVILSAGVIADDVIPPTGRAADAVTRMIAPTVGGAVAWLACSAVVNTGHPAPPPPPPPHAFALLVYPAVCTSQSALVVAAAATALQGTWHPATAHHAHVCIMASDVITSHTRAACKVLSHSYWKGKLATFNTSINYDACKADVLYKPGLHMHITPCF